MTPAPGRDDTTGAGEEHLISNHVYGVEMGGPYPAATPGRGELREQIAAAVAEVARSIEAVLLDFNLDDVPVPMTYDGPPDTPIETIIAVAAAAAVMEPVDAWVAAHTAELEALRDEVSRYRKDFWVLSGQRDKARAAVARVRALCDEAEASHEVNGSYGSPKALVLVRLVRAALDPPKDGA